MAEKLNLPKVLVLNKETLKHISGGIAPSSSAYPTDCKTETAGGSGCTTCAGC